MASGLTSEKPRIGADGKLKPHCEIACSWKEGAHGLVIEAIDLAPAPRGRKHEAHEISVYAGLLICDCQAYTFSRWHPNQPKECGHLCGNDGLDGAAAFLEAQSKRRDLNFRQRAIVSASHGDPHRTYVRQERTRRALEAQLMASPAASAPLAQMAASDGHRRADASQGHKLEEFFS